MADQPVKSNDELMAENATLTKLVTDMQAQLSQAKKDLDGALADRQADIEQMKEFMTQVTASSSAAKAKNELLTKILERLQAILVGAHWPTSITGYLAGLGIALYPAFQAGRLPTTQECIQAFGFVFLGRFAKSTYSAASAPAASKPTMPSTLGGAST
ncbi:MAG: hypothetical protein ACLQBD_18340 [Syntrophobacteraceae bacterium]